MNDLVNDPAPFEEKVGDKALDLTVSVYLMMSTKVSVAGWINDDRGAYWEWVDARAPHFPANEVWRLPAAYVEESISEGLTYTDDCNILNGENFGVDTFAWTRGAYDRMVKKYPWTSVWKDDRFPEVTDPGPQPTEGQETLFDEQMERWIGTPERHEEAPHYQPPTARATDPGTSWAAAKSVRNVTDTHSRILALLEFGPKTDEEIFIGLARNGYKVSQSGARTRRKEMVDIGKIVKRGEKRGMTNRLMTVWGLPEVANG